MTLTISGNQFETLPVGTFLGVCYKIVDFGTREEIWQDQEPAKRKKIHVTWEIPSELMDDGRPFAVSKTYNATLHEKANLHKDLVTWRGKPFSEEDLLGFDVSKMIGAPAMLHVEHTDKGKPRIKAIFKPDEFKLTKTINDPVIFDLDHYCNEFNGNHDERSKAAGEVFENLLEWQQNLIKESFEYQAVAVNTEQKPTTGGLSSFVKEEDHVDIPF